MAIGIPTNIKLIQWSEGQVTLQSSLPENATHYRIYLSEIKDSLGTLAATITPIDYPDGPAVFEAQKGILYYVTVRGYNSQSGEEGTNTDQILLQMYEVLQTGHTISCFFHEPDGAITWGVGSNKTTGKISLLRSTDYFSSCEIIKTWDPTELKTDAPYLTFYIDKFGHKYISARPIPLICRQGTETWEPLSAAVGFMSPDTSLLVPGWSVSENDSQLIVLAEYGGYGTPPNITPHRRILMCNEPSRTNWTERDFSGQYKHIHFYQINPYNTQVHLIGLGDFLDGNDPTPPGGYSPGMYISTDGGSSFGGNVLSGLPEAPPGGFNAPCTATFYPDGRAFVTNDTWGKYGYWWGFGQNGWDGVDLKLSLIRDVYPILSNYVHGADEVGYPVTPWSAITIKGKFETYGCTNSDNTDSTNAPMPLFRYEGDTGKITVITASRDYGLPFKYISSSRGNVIPAEAKYIFNDGYGGIRIPREV